MPTPVQRRISAVTLTVAFSLPLVAIRVQSQSASDSAREAARKIVIRVAPRYPPLAGSMALEGSVRADVLVEPNGLMKSASFKGGHPLFVQAAQKVLGEWKWEPALHETHETVDLKFTRPASD